MSRRLISYAAVVSVAVSLALPAFAAGAVRPIGTTIFQIGKEDRSDHEFSGFGFSTDFTCHVGVDCTAKNFPRAMVVPSAVNDEYLSQNAVRVTIDFDLPSSYQDLVLRLARGGAEAMNVVVDGGAPHRVTGGMLGSREGFFVGTYNLELGALEKGSHSIAFTVVDDGMGSGSFQWDALALIAPAHGRVEQVTVHSRALEGNLLGDSPDRAVSVYLPPGYDRDTQTRYPVVYLLHGFTATNTMWLGRGYLPGMDAPAIADRLYDSGRIQPMILVMPDASNRYGGSFYADSSVSGDWEDFITGELVSFVDAHFRTIARPTGRALAGHSMGGYGALVLAMKHPETFSVSYAMSPAYDFVDPEAAASLSPEAFDMTLGWLKMGVVTEDHTEAKQLALAAAFSPDPANPPYYVDLPYKDEEASPYRAPASPPQRLDAVWQRWLAHSPLAMAHDLGMNLLLYRGVAFDIGSNDDPALVAGARALDRALTRAGVPHRFEVYQGDHTNRVTARFASLVLPFVSGRLEGSGTSASTGARALP